MFWELGQTKRGLQVLQDPQQLNSYSYARNNPVLYVDPSGEVVETVWDIGNIAYDIGRGVKNVGEIIGGAISYGVGTVKGDEYLKEASSKGLKSDIKDLGEVGLDVGTDALATIVPFVPAGGSKVVRKVDDVVEESVKVNTNYGKIQLTEHAIQRTKDRNISIDQIKNTINGGENFNYIKDGKTLQGFYDSNSKIFVGKGDNGITTVIDNVSKNYIKNLKTEPGK